MVEQPSPELADLRHQLLVVTDRAVGAEAALDRAEADVARTAAELRATRAERDRLAGELAAVKASETWRVGNALVGTAARLTGRRRASRR